MAVKPHKKLINNKKYKNTVRNKTCYPERNNRQYQIKIQKIFLLDETLDSGSEWFNKMIFFQIIELINNTSCQNRKNCTKNNPMNFKIKHKFPERLFLIKQKKSGNI